MVHTAKNESYIRTYDLNPHYKMKFLWTLIAGLIIISSGRAVCADSRDRLAAVYFSDGKVLTGRISLSPGRKFKLNIPKGGTIKTSDMVTGEDVQYGKVRLFTFEPVREIRFYPTKEEMRRNWKFIEKTKYDEKTAKADYTPAAKSYTGDAYPLRYLNATVIFESGEIMQGHLYSAIVYLQTGQDEPDKQSKLDKLGGRVRRHKLILRSKQRGKQGTTLNDLVYVRRIKLLEKGKEIAAKITVKFLDMRFDPNDAVQAVTRESLTPVPTKKTDKDDTFIVESTFGEEFYLAARQEGRYIVGWPGQQNDKLFALAEDHLKRQRDFYNDRELLGVLENKKNKEVLTLVSLRRKVAPTHFGDIGGEWDKDLGTVVEPWRLSIWRWKYDEKNQELILSARGTFFRVIFQTDAPTPTVVTSEKLWNIQRLKDSVLVGKKETSNDKNQK